MTIDRERKAIRDSLSFLDTWTLGRLIGLRSVQKTRAYPWFRDPRAGVYLDQIIAKKSHENPK